MKWYWMLLTIVFAILGISTLLPTPASKPSMLGYYAHCTFAPVSTVICWAIAVVFYCIGRKRVT